MIFHQKSFDRLDVHHSHVMVFSLKITVKQPNTLPCITKITLFSLIADLFQI